MRVILNLLFCVYWYALWSLMRWLRRLLQQWCLLLLLYVLLLLLNVLLLLHVLLLLLLLLLFARPQARGGQSQHLGQHVHFGLGRPAFCACVGAS
jgi:hypothetical protein